MKPCKRLLAILLAALMIGGAMAVGASAADEAIELTDEQYNEIVIIAMPLFVAFSHAELVMVEGVPEFLLFQAGKNLQTFALELFGALEALALEYGLSVNFGGLNEAGELVLSEDPLGMITEGDLLDIYLEGRLGGVVSGIVAAYEKAMKNNFNFLVSGLYFVMKWYFNTFFPEWMILAYFNGI